MSGIYDAYKNVESLDVTSDSYSYITSSIDEKDYYYVGKDKDGYISLLISMDVSSGNKPPPIQLKHLLVIFSLQCSIYERNNFAKQGCFSIITCRSLDNQVIDYFLSIGDILIRLLGERPTPEHIEKVVICIINIFQKMQSPSKKSLNGLFGELFYIYQAVDCKKILKAWHVEDNARFDFSDDIIRIEVKTTSKRKRVHWFTYAQCNSSPETIAIVASMFIEEIGTGLTLKALLNSIEMEVAGYPELILKLHENVATVLGDKFVEALERRFDAQLALSSLELFDLHSIPAIRETLPNGVNDVIFDSELPEDLTLSQPFFYKIPIALKSLLPKKY